MKPTITEPTPEQCAEWWATARKSDRDEPFYCAASRVAYAAGLAAGAAQQRETDAADARRYRWLAADGDRAKRLLNERSGHEVQDEIDMAIRAQQEAKG
jgi:hypothetical protein